MIQRLDCSKCGVNAADKDLIALPMTHICHDCFSKQKTLEERIKELEKALRQARQYYRKNKPIAMFSVIEQALK